MTAAKYPVTVRFTVTEARELALAAEQGVAHVYVYREGVKETVARLREAAERAEAKGEL